MKKYDITARQLEVLDFINELGSISQKDLSEHLEVKHTTVIELLKKLQEKELINKSQNEENAKYNVIFFALTIVGAILCITHKVNNAGYAVIPMSIKLVFSMLYRNSKKAIEENRK